MSRAAWRVRRVRRGSRKSVNSSRLQEPHPRRPKAMAIDLSAENARTLKDLVAGRFPDERGRYGPFGGRYVPEILIPAHERLERGARRWLADSEFQAELNRELQDWVGRPTALTPTPPLSTRWGASVWLKREDLA